jgi:hypothetical protein
LGPLSGLAGSEHGWIGADKGFIDNGLSVDWDTLKKFHFFSDYALRWGSRSDFGVFFPSLLSSPLYLYPNLL